MRIVFFLSVLLLLGCNSDSPKKNQEIIKTTHKEIEQRFAANGVEAASYYDGKTVELTGTVNTIYEYGTVILVGDGMDSFAVNFSGESTKTLKNIKAGDKLTVKCKSISSLSISQCE